MIYIITVDNNEQSNRTKELKMGTIVTNLQKNGKITSIVDALDAADLNFIAEEIPLVGMNGIDIPNHKAIFRGDTNTYLGLVGSAFSPTQNSLAFAFADTITKKYGYSFTKAISKDNGAISILVAQSERPDEIRKGDIALRQIEFINGFTGKTALSVQFSLLRLICTNGMTRSESESVMKFKHTQSIQTRMELGARIFDDSVKFHDDFVRTAKMLAEKAVDAQMVEKFINGLFSDSPQNNTKKDTITDLFQRGLGNNGESLFDLYSGVTEYSQHHHGDDGKRAEYSIFGSGRKLDDKAWDLAVSLL